MTGLVPGSPLASVLLQVWNGEPAVSYPASWRTGWLRLPVDMAVELGRRSGTVPSVLFLCPTERTAGRAQYQLARMCGHDTRRPSFDSFAAPDDLAPTSQWCAEVRANIRVGSRWEEESPDILVAHPWLCPRRLREALGNWPVKQLLAPGNHPALRLNDLARVEPRNFGTPPMEVVLAGAPR